MRRKTVIDRVQLFPTAGKDQAGNRNEVALGARARCDIEQINRVYVLRHHLDDGVLKTRVGTAHSLNRKLTREFKAGGFLCGTVVGVAGRHVRSIAADY